MTISTNGTGTHAIVIGGSIAGLWAARVLTDHFDRVTILDRDQFPDKAEFRNGVPQAHHVHILLARGLQILEQLFPDLLGELAAAGAFPIDFAQDVAFLGRTGWSTSYYGGIPTLAASRILLETMIRQRLAKHPAIRFVQSAEVTELVANEAKTHVTGVQIHYRRAADRPDDETLSADLIVDASGRTSMAPDWLDKLGYQRPEETIINSFLGYSTRWYKRPAGYTAPWKMLFVGTSPPALPRGGVVLEVEGGQWIATLAGAAREYPPIDEAGFLDFSKSLLTRAVYDAIKDAEPVSPIYGYQRTANQLRHYDRLPQFPDNFVVLGDAACCFNPIYGQGMSASGIGALALDECLRQGRGDGMARRFQKQLANVTENPWLLATGEDFRYPTTEGGKRTFMTRFSHWYTDKVVLAIPGNQEVGQAFLKVNNLLKPPTSLFQPAIVAKVAAASIKNRGAEFPTQFDAPRSWKQTTEKRPV